MTLDIRGSLKNTKINQHYYAVIDELFSNAIDSYLIRKNENQSLLGLKVEFVIEFFDKNLDGSDFDFKITCTDYGAGMGDNQTKAFVTKDTSYKDDLAIVGIGKCKGSGRIQFLHYFSKMSIDSVYLFEKGLRKRELYVDDGVKEIDENSFKTQDVKDVDIKTVITLDKIKPEIYEKLFTNKDLREEFSVDSLKSHVLIAFLQRFVNLKDKLGEFSISFKSKYKDQEKEIVLIPKDLPETATLKELKIFYMDANGAKTSQFEKFAISHYKLDKEEFNLKRNTVALCAKSSAVMFITNRYLKTKTIENNDINGFYHIILIESDYLDKRVNEQRDNYDIPIDSKNVDVFLSNLISLEEIYEYVDDYIINLLSPPDWDKEQIIESIENKYGVSSDMVSEANVRIRYGDTEETVVKRVLS